MRLTPALNIERFTLSANGGEVAAGTNDVGGKPIRHFRRHRTIVAGKRVERPARRLQPRGHDAHVMRDDLNRLEFLDQRFGRASFKLRAPWSSMFWKATISVVAVPHPACRCCDKQFGWKARALQIQCRIGEAKTRGAWTAGSCPALFSGVAPSVFSCSSTSA